MDAPGRVADMLGEVTKPGEFPVDIDTAGSLIRMAYAQGYLDAPSADEDELAEARADQVEAWARLPVPE